MARPNLRRCAVGFLESAGDRPGRPHVRSRRPDVVAGAGAATIAVPPFLRVAVFLGTTAIVACGPGNSTDEGSANVSSNEPSGSSTSHAGGSSASSESAGSPGSSTEGGTSETASDAGGSSGGSVDSGSSGSGSSSSANGTACRPKFASGVNIAWFNYASDVPNPDISKFTSLYTNVYNAGGRIIRWWFHTNGSVTPGYQSDGMATPISQDNISDVKSILDAAYSAGVAVNISLWAFDMLSGGQNAPIANNELLLTNDTNRQAYITNVLTPLVTALQGYHGLYSWEIFNEPEGMTTQNGWTTSSGGMEIDESYVQKTVNWFADAIHTADPNALVTNGAWTFKANANISGDTDYYSDSALVDAGGRSKGTLDYYQVHYYDNWGTPGGAESVSPFQNDVSHWGLTDGKPVVIGEFWDIDTYANGTSTIISSADLYTTLYGYGYAGAWAWQYANADNPGPMDYPNNSEQTTWGPLMQTSIQNLYNADQSSVLCQ